MKKMRKSGWRRLVSWLFTLALVLSIVTMTNKSLKVYASDIRVIIDRQMFLENVRARLSEDDADMSIENIKIAEKVPETVQSTVALNSSGTVVCYVLGDTLYIAPKYEGDTVALPVDASYMFYELKYIKNIDLSGLDTSSVVNMEWFVNSNPLLETLNLDGIDTSNVENMGFAFAYNEKLTALDVSGFDTSNVTRMDSLFSKCEALKSLDISSFNYENITMISGFMGDCINLQSLNLGDFPVDKFVDATNKFTNCSPRYICCPSDVYEKILPEFTYVVAPQLHHFSGQPYYYIGKGTHFRKCEFCGIDDELEDCVGGEVTCEHGKICVKCNTEYTKKREHKPLEAVMENVVSATHDTPNSYDLVVYCEHCKEELSRETFTGSVLPPEDDPVALMKPEKPSNQEKPVGNPNLVGISYRTHVQTYGWQAYVTNGAVAGTSGQAKRLEAINIRVQGSKNLGIQYTTHVQTYGWLPWASDGAMSGTEGEAKRLEAIMIKLTGSAASDYDVYYRVHAQTYGWLAWTKNGAPAGTAGLGKRLEAIQIMIVKKGDKLNQKMGNIISDNASAYIQRAGTGSPVVPDSALATVTYRTHVQTYGWQGWKYNGTMAGTSGKAKRLEAINIKLTNAPYSGSVQYRTHIQSYGWEKNWKQDGQLSGTSGKAKRLEAIQIRLTGEMAAHYDIYYRVHAQTYGWLGWAKNGESAGTEGLSKRLEGIEIVLVPKGGDAPRSEKPFVK